MVDTLGRQKREIGWGRSIKLAGITQEDQLLGVQQIKFQVPPDLHVQQEHLGPLGLLGPPVLPAQQADGLLFPSRPGFHAQPRS
jgi:hypothetical protein